LHDFKYFDAELVDQKEAVYQDAFAVRSEALRQIEFYYSIRNSDCLQNTPLCSLFEQARQKTSSNWDNFPASPTIFHRESFAK